MRRSKGLKVTKSHIVTSRILVHFWGSGQNLQTSGIVLGRWSFYLFGERLPDLNKQELLERYSEENIQPTFAALFPDLKKYLEKYELYDGLSHIDIVMQSEYHISKIEEQCNQLTAYNLQYLAMNSVGRGDNHV
jgi:hypothetical protein